VHARQEGFVQSIKVLPGDFVKRGQILAVLENRDYLRLQEMYLTAKSELNYLQKELKRQQELRAEDINAEKTLQQVERDLQIKQAQEASLRQQLALLGLNTQNLQAQNLQAYFSLVSPIMGYVETVDLSMGEFVSMNKPLIKIKGTEHKHLELMVFEKEATMINKGQKITFQVPSLGQERYGAEVFLVGQSFDAKAKTINVHAHILDAKMEEKLVPGMFVNANILLPAQSHATLPEEAIIQEGKNYFVFLKGKEQGGKVFFDKIAVKVFNTQDGYTAFAPEKAIPQKAQFVQKGAYYLQAQLMNAGEE
jgi:cobalt-zinc-cadmium efflux system membrane fusion protein